MIESLLGALLIFGLRICDVSIGTIRVIYMIRGNRLVAASLGFVEAGIFIFAITRILGQVNDPIRMIGYAAGFATGTLVGMTLEKWIASGYLLTRVILREKRFDLVQRLREEDFGTTIVRGEGQGGEVFILFIVSTRKRGPQVLSIVQEIEPKAFITIDPIQQAFGGYLPHLPSATTSHK